MRLLREDLTEEPMSLLRNWLAAAEEAGQLEPTAMALGTATPEGMPSLRHVLAKELRDEGIVFFSDQRSRKGQAIASNARAVACFWWASIKRQVTVEGAVEQLSRDEAGRYFASRPYESQLSSWSSRQGQVVTLDELEASFAEVSERYPPGEVPLPPHWTGYLIRASRVEFWKQGDYRRHDRFQYLAEGDSWRVERLSP